MKAWFMSREPRERTVLGIGASAAVAILFWGALWMPLNRGLTVLQDRVASERALLVDLHRVAPAPDLTANGSHPSIRSMIVLVDRTTRAHGLAGVMTGTQPDGQDRIQISFQGARFDSLMGWLLALRSQYGIRVESASINGRSPGLVNGQILLRRP